MYMSLSWISNWPSSLTGIHISVLENEKCHKLFHLLHRITQLFYYSCPIFHDTFFNPYIEVSGALIWATLDGRWQFQSTYPSQAKAVSISNLSAKISKSTISSKNLQKPLVMSGILRGDGFHSFFLMDKDEALPQQRVRKW